MDLTEGWRTPLIIAGVIAVAFYLGFYVIGLRSAPHQMPIQVAVSLTPLSAPFYVAEEIDAYADTCVTVSIEDVIGGQRAFEKVSKGEVDFGTSSDSVIAYQSLSDAPFVSHAMFVQSDNDVKLISRSDANVNSASDLTGLRIGVTSGTASEYFLNSLLALEGLTFKDVDIVSFAPNKLQEAIAAKKVDVIVPWEPYAFEALSALNETVKLHDTKNLNSLSFNLISKEIHHDEGLEKTRCLLAGLVKATEYIAVNPEVSRQIVKNKLKVKQAFIDWVWQDYIFKLSLDNSLLLSIESQATWIAEQQNSSRSAFSSQHFVNYIDSRALLSLDSRLVNIY